MTMLHSLILYNGNCLPPRNISAMPMQKYPLEVTIPNIQSQTRKLCANIKDGKIGLHN